MKKHVVVKFSFRLPTKSNNCCRATAFWGYCHSIVIYVSVVTCWDQPVVGNPYGITGKVFINLTLEQLV